jgi:glutaminase
MASLERRYNLPAPEIMQSLVQGTHRRSKSNSDDKNSRADPALAQVASGVFGVCVVGISRRTRCAGNVDHEFTIMSV